MSIRIWSRIRFHLVSPISFWVPIITTPASYSPFPSHLASPPIYKHSLHLQPLPSHLAHCILQPLPSAWYASTASSATTWLQAPSAPPT